MVLEAVVRACLKHIDSEQAHQLAIKGLSGLNCLGLLPKPCNQNQAINLLGLEFPNCVGLAAGFDKNGEAIHALSRIGFGHVEVGTVTPRPQPGNPRPRMFRLDEDEAIINRMGFNNQGVYALVRRLDARPFDGILGINIGRNKSTHEAEAHLDYLTCLEAVYAYASYITVNISSPNTPGLRKLQHQEQAKALLSVLKDRSEQLAARHGQSTPLLLKIAPDLERDQIESIAQVVKATEFDGMIATNTTIECPSSLRSRHAQEEGGLSGAPLRHASTSVLLQLRKSLGADFPIISVGGIMSPHDAEQRLNAGADLIQLYSGMIFHGLPLIRACSNLDVRTQR